MLHIHKGRHRRPLCMWSIREYLAGNYLYVGNLFTDETDGTTFIVPIIFAVADISADISIGNL